MSPSSEHQLKYLPLCEVSLPSLPTTLGFCLQPGLLLIPDTSREALCYALLQLLILTSASPSLARAS